MALRVSWRVFSLLRQQQQQCSQLGRSLAGNRGALQCKSSLSSSSDTDQTNKGPKEVPWAELEDQLKKLSPSSPPDPRDVVSNRFSDEAQREAAGFGKTRKKSDDGETATVQLPIIHVRATYNNTMFTITDHSGRVLAWTSAGAEGFKNARKGTTFAAQSAGLAAAKKAQKLGLNMVDVKLKGPGPGRQSALKGLEMGAMKVVSIQDVTPIPHNGCRPRKARRH